jgi:hypothetical protein
MIKFWRRRFSRSNALKIPPLQVLGPWIVITLDDHIHFLIETIGEASDSKRWTGLSRNLGFFFMVSPCSSGLATHCVCFKSAGRSAMQECLKELQLIMYANMKIRVFGDRSLIVVAIFVLFNLKVFTRARRNMVILVHNFSTNFSLRWTIPVEMVVENCFP